MPWPSALPMWAPHSPETSMVECKMGGATPAESEVGGVGKWSRIWDHNEAPFSGPFFGPQKGPQNRVTQQCVTLIVVSFCVRKTGSELEPHCGTAFGPKWWHTVREKVGHRRGHLDGELRSGRDPGPQTDHRGPWSVGGEGLPRAQHGFVNVCVCGVLAWQNLALPQAVVACALACAGLFFSVSAPALRNALFCCIKCNIAKQRVKEA